jgi:hypothetical protein
MAPKTEDRVSVKTEDEDESQSRGISYQEKETGGGTPVPDAVVVPRQGRTNLASLLVKRLLDPSAAETTIDYIIGFELHKEENFGACDDLKSTDICKNLVAAMDQQNANNNRSNNSAIFQTKCCTLIAILTYQSDHFRNGFRLAGAVKAIGISMTNNPDLEDSQFYACLALRFLSFNANQSDAKKMIDDGAIDAVLDAMKCHPESKRIQEQSCTFLYTIIFNYPTCAADLMEKGCIESVLNAMETHLADEDIQEEACDFLIELSEAKPDALKRIKEKSGALTLVKVEEHHQGKDADIENKANTLLKMIYK